MLDKIMTDFVRLVLATCAQATIAVVSSWVQQSCNVQKNTLHRTHSFLPSNSFILSTTSFAMFSDPWWHHSNIPLRAKHSTDSAVWPWVSTLIAAHFREKLLWSKLRETVIYENKHKYSGGRLTICQFSKIIVIGPPWSCILLSHGL